MKFVLNKSQYGKVFNFLKYIEKFNLQYKENKNVDSNSLIFSVKENKLFVVLNTGVVFAIYDLNVEIESSLAFAVDINLFCNAFNNFPFDEINFAYLEENNMLVCGNKKTRVSIKTTQISNCKLDELDYLNSLSYQSYDYGNFVNCIKLGSISCSLDIEDYPYSSLMIFLNNSEFNCYSSDKHKIAIYGNEYDNQKSYLLSKSSADIMLSYLKDTQKVLACFDNNTLVFKSEYSFLKVSLDLNNHSKLFQKFDDFFKKSEKLISTKIEKSALQKSVKFVSSIYNSDFINFKFENNNLIISTNKNDKSNSSDKVFTNELAADKITLIDDVQTCESTYVSSHILKYLDIENDNLVTIEILNYNEFKLMLFKSFNSNYLVFPKS